MKQENKSATILEIQRMSTEDGPGLRTSIFFKGCPLSCLWCHNPESILIKPQVQWIENKCLMCGICVESCPEIALILSSEGIIIDRDLCKGCGTCTDKCPTMAMEMLGKEWTLKELVHEVLKDAAYFESSDGGITVTGGEPVLHASFVQEFLKIIKEKGISTALDTCGLCSFQSLELLLPNTDILLFDFKISDPDLHKEYTGQSNEKIIRNLLYIRDYMQAHSIPKTLWIRTPLIPEITATEENIKGIGRFLQEHLPGKIQRWELCAFNNMCRDKYRRLGLQWPFEKTPLMEKNFLDHLVSVAKQTGVDPHIIHWTGSSRLELT